MPAAEQASASAAQTNAAVEFYRLIDADNMVALWDVLHSLVPPSPRTPCVPAGWRYRDVRRYLIEAGRLVTAREAQRRVLILENPALRGKSSITQTLYAGMQLLLPGEVAPAHRHSQSALRLVLEGEGAYTVVDGERTNMLFGDFIITPSMTWHEHANPGSEVVVWLDGLDIPLVSFLDAGFAESSAQEASPVLRPEQTPGACFGANLAPFEYVPGATGASPLINYRYSRTRKALEMASESGRIDAWLGIALRFLNPTTGTAPIATIGTHVQWLPEGFRGLPYRSTDGRTFCCLEGEGRVETDTWSFDFGARDTFVVPAWCTYRLHAAERSILFGFSDRPLQQAVGLWREERLS